MTMYQIRVDYDSQINHFVVTLPRYANEFVKAFPSRRFNGKRSAWLAPLTRKNVEYARQLAKMAGVEVTPAAAEAMKETDDHIKNMRIEGAFPAWYPFKNGPDGDKPPLKHQKAGLNKGYPLKSFALFMDMQTGKSRVAEDLATAHRMEGHIDAVLILVKFTLRDNWRLQFENWCPIPFSFFKPDTEKQKSFHTWLSSPHDYKVCAIGWESLSAGKMRDMARDFVRSFRSPLVIGDETTYIAGHKAERSLQAVDIAQNHCEYKYALTGTPIPDGPLNVFMQFEFLDPQIIGIGDFYAFRNRYAVMGGYTPKEGKHKGRPLQIVGYQNIDELTKTVAPYVHQVLKKDEYDLPPKRYEVRTLQLTKAQRKLYDEVKKDEQYSINGKDVILQNVLEKELRLHQIAGGYTVDPREVLRRKKTGEEVVKHVYDPVELIAPKDNPKVQEFMSIVEEAGKRQGLGWAMYLPEIGALRWALKHMGIKFGELHGGVPEKDRLPTVERFNRGEHQWLIGNASTGGMGYTMMESEVNIFFSNSYKLIDRLQAEDRAWGQGQTKSGIWIDLIMEKTVDVTRKKAIDEKQNLADFIKSRIGDAIKLLDGDI